MNDGELTMLVDTDYDAVVEAFAQFAHDYTVENDE